MDPEETRRRVKAARALAGISVKELAQRIGQEGLGERTLRALEGDAGRAWRTMELQAVAQACDLPYEFFTIDFSSLGRTTEAERLNRVERALAIIASTLSLEKLDADEAQVLRRWQQRSDLPSGGEGRGSQSLGGE